MERDALDMNGPRRLLLLNYEFPPLGGGAANATLFLGRALVSLGHRVTVLTSALGRDESYQQEHGITIHRLRADRKYADRSTVGEMIRYARVAAWRSPALARAERADGAIAFFTIPSGLVARWLWFRLRLPYVVSLRGSDVPGHDVTLNRTHAMTRPFRRSVLRKAAAVIANSDSLATTSREADPFPVHVIPNGVDCDLFHPSKQSRGTAEPFRLLFVGRLHREKNLAVVLRQMAALPENLSAKLELLVAGGGAQSEELAAMAERLGLTARVRWLGWQKKEDLPALYREADALVNPSLYEGMPNVVLEAMASGLPVVASDIPGNRSVLQAGQTGLLFRLEREDELGTALQTLLRDRARAEALGRAGRQRAERDFSWVSAAKCYLELLPAPSANSRLL